MLVLKWTYHMVDQVLASYKLFKSSDQDTSGPWKFAETQIVAVDECSMVSVELFHWLLKYLVEGSDLRKIVLLGDHLQLPSVDPGNFMADLCAALASKGELLLLLQIMIPTEM
jgi:ATP-dependent exoDNAse (exonuclease V) alpha subunit